MSHLLQLQSVILDCAPVALAISGGIDSLCLGTFCHNLLGFHQCLMFHAFSAAVPQKAYNRLLLLAKQENWHLNILDAGELTDVNYISNTQNRCYHCKNSIYGAIKKQATAQMISGANIDDLDEYRPGLQAALEQGVRHPFIEAGFDKTMVRALARELGLQDYADLPSSPCLASRIEHGTKIDPETLLLVDKVENRLFFSGNLRCRVRSDGIVVELDGSVLPDLSAAQLNSVIATVKEVFPQQNISIRAYQRPLDLLSSGKCES